ncbi:DNA-processing protein DprA [Neisseria leonii]|uniref:DNA-processing protein DprA n=1 Tax=Neisseria leonii TaxID=2995413 RepID=A0A9X4E1M1_9NEIS|nr:MULTISPECIES: DNA-processing protein DprA [unclassified Neisseria]MDD9325750.1 DNA-processing protein DprA [Neisseria sp. 3986]MDD9327891.1 DNA-processing protein DprA [Neisseria sp. 51.81]
MQQEERDAWLCLALLPQVGADTFARLLAHFGSARSAWRAGIGEAEICLPRSAAREAWRNRRAEAEAAAEAALAWVRETENARLLLSCDPDFPLMLHEGITPPPLLFVRGNVAMLHRPALAVVGSRHATPQALRIARDFSQALSAAGIVVVSGMASGIDTAAHQGALAGGGGTAAVWGTGIDRVYPAANRSLAHDIAASGVIVSEFPLGARPLAGHFPRRNRIIAALAQAVLVVEAAVESGSLITARLAAEMGREVLAVPGSIDNPHSKGCHKLIKDGAKLTECLEDILIECPGLLQTARSSAYAIKNNAPPDGGGAERPQAVFQTAGSGGDGDGLLDAMGFDSVHPDSLAERLNRPAADVYAGLLELELAGRVAAAGGGRYQRTG